MAQTAGARHRGPWRRGLAQLRGAPLVEPARLVGLSLLVGIVGGVGALVFRWLIAVFRSFFVGFLFGRGAGWPPHLATDIAFLSPAAGLLLVGCITTYLASEVKGHGVPQILEALALRRGRIRPRVALFGILAPALTIGAEGSVGREGPIALIGASFGSVIGQILHLDDRQTSLLLASGAAAGIGATFNAPIAGALFGLEVVLGSYAMGALVPCFVASVTGVTVFDWFHGSAPILPTHAFAFTHPFGAAFMLPLGLLAGAVALAYTRGLNLVEELNERLPGAFWTKALVGGLAIGLIGFALPQVLGVGYSTMEAAATPGRLAVATLALLFVGKYVATLLTIGAGGSGGVFAPSLFLGVTLSGTYGLLLHHWLPAYTGPGALYAVAGMSAVFAAAAQAPLTAATIILEMTGDYHLATGVMVACAVSYIFYGSLARDSMYTVRLTKRGIQILRGSEVRPLQRVAVSAAMERQVLRLDPTATVEEAYQELVTSGAKAALVVDGDGTLVGVLDAPQVFGAVTGGRDAGAVGDLARRDVPVLTPDASLDDAMARFAIHAVSLIPVVARPGGRKPLGAVTQDAVLQGYYRHTVLTLEMQHRIDVAPKETAHEGRFREIAVPERWGGAGAVRVADLSANLPRGVLLVAVRRGDDHIVVRGETEIRGGDRILLYAAEDDQLSAAERLLLSGRIRPGRDRGSFRTVVVHGDNCAGVPVRDLRLPGGVLLVSVSHGDATLVPEGSTRLADGDTVLLYGTDPERLENAEHLLTGERA